MAKYEKLCIKPILQLMTLSKVCVINSTESKNVSIKGQLHQNYDFFRERLSLDNFSIDDLGLLVLG